MPDLSVIIPSRNEKWLRQTVESIRSAIRGDTEIIVVIDGEEAQPLLPPIWPDGPTVQIIRNPAPLGQRQSINIAARASTAKFLLKTDAHSMFEDGFDLKLMADCEYDWTVLPRMYNLHAFDLICRTCGTRNYNRGDHRPCPQCGGTSYDREIIWQPNWRRKTDWMWFRSPTCKDRPMRVAYWGGKDWICDACGVRHDAVPDNGQCDNCGGRKFHKELGYEAETMAHRRWAKLQGEIADVMNGQGACWFLHRQRYWDLGGLDENHGSWGQMGVEVALKAWLSGGRHVVNRKTWFAHLFRCGDGESFPYAISGNSQEKARQYSIDFWSNNRWPLQKRSLAWLIEKFWPVPTWPKPEIVPELRDFAQPCDQADRSDQTDRPDQAPRAPEELTVLYYTDGSLPGDFAAAVRNQMQQVAFGLGHSGARLDLPLVVQIQPPEWPKNHESIYRNILAGLEKVTTPFVALAEHDVLYPEHYFDHRPTHDIEYNKNRWCLHADLGEFSRRPEMALSQCFARTDVLRKAIMERLSVAATFAEHSKSFEPGNRGPIAEVELGLTPMSVGRFKSMHPTIDITGHGYNLTGPKKPHGKTRDRMKYWGAFAEVVARFQVPGSIPVCTCMTCGHTFRVWDHKVIGSHSEEPSGEEYNEYGCPKCGAPEEKWAEVANSSRWHRNNKTADAEESKPGTAAEVLARFGVPRPQAGDRRPEAVATASRLQPTVSPKVSILIPARNEEYLEATVRDLLKNLRLDFEILIGLDGPDQSDPKINDRRVRVIQSEQRIGMRPMINRLALAAKGEYLIRLDAHCMIAAGMDQALVELCEKEGHITAVAMRYELNPRHWQRREKTDIPYRRLSHVSEDGRGLRSLPWPEYAESHQEELIGETMTCSGSSWTCRRSTFVDWWGGFDEKHGTFGQEGVEISCMTWLSGGRMLVHKGTWYAHWNRGKSTYALGAKVKDQSIKRSHELWPGNSWKYARYGFEWLLEKFQPPGWDSEISNFKSQVSSGIAAIEQRSLCKARKRLRVDDLWTARMAISDPGKRHRLTIFWRAYEEFVHSVLAGAPLLDGQYQAYLLGHIRRRVGSPPKANERRKVQRDLQGNIKLIEDIRKNGFRAPLEFYQEEGRMILWKGYRRLVIARALGIGRVVGRCLADRQAAGSLSPQNHLTRLQDPPVTALHDLGAEQFRRWSSGATDKYYTHAYTRLYDLHLHGIRKRVRKVLELGILNGASLALWRDYFPQAEIFGVDIDPERWKMFAGDLPNTQILIGDERDQDFMAGVAGQGPFDLIVDDASHAPALQAETFQRLWPAVKQYGFYVMEDIFRAYEPDAAAACLPPGLESRIYRERDVLALHHHHNIVFIQRA